MLANAPASSAASRSLRWPFSPTARFGMFACVGLIVHLILTLALMTLIGSTLTLPGIAGLVLGVAMAVDANVLIYERIREELRAGKTPVAAIDAGFAARLRDHRR